MNKASFRSLKPKLLDYCDNRTEADLALESLLVEFDEHSRNALDRVMERIEAKHLQRIDRACDGFLDGFDWEFSRPEDILDAYFEEFCEPAARRLLDFVFAHIASRDDGESAIFEVFPLLGQCCVHRVWVYYNHVLRTIDPTLSSDEEETCRILGERKFEPILKGALARNNATPRLSASATVAPVRVSPEPKLLEFLDDEVVRVEAELVHGSASATRGKRLQRKGYRAEVKKWMKDKEIQTISIAARRLGVSASTLKSIMSNKGKVRYSQETLARVLRAIGVLSD